MSYDYQVIGRGEIRKDAAAKACGSARYIADIPMPDANYGFIIRSPHHHARILSIDTALAKNQPGVLAILTADDIPGSKTFGLTPDQPALADGVVRYLGEPVVLVVARDCGSAKQAAAMVKIDYEPLAAVHDPAAALEAGAPLVHPGGDLLAHFNVDSGNLTEGFAAADVILEENFSVQRVAPAYLEPENSLARCNPDGSLTVWVSSQEPFIDRLCMAAVLGIPPECVQVQSTVIGGAFGGREDSSLAVITALGAWVTKSTVRIINTRSESFLAHPKRHPAKIHLKLGALHDGTLLALDGQVWMNTGAYASYGAAVGSLLTEMVAGPYRIPHVSIDTKVVYTHSPISGAMRGFGSPQAHFAIESALDMLADRLGMDPAELRRRNLLRQGDALPTRVILNETALGLEPILEHAIEARNRFEKIPCAPGKVSGVGLALAMQSMGLGNKVPDRSETRMEWLPDGKVLIHLGAPDLGQGLTTIAEQITAEALGLPFDQVITAPFDSLDTPDGGVTCASRMTYLVGNSMIAGAAALQNELLECAAAQLHLSTTKLGYRNGRVILSDGTDFAASEISSRAAESGRPVQASGVFDFPYPEATTPQHLPVGMPHVKYVFAAQVARVEVDAQTGQVDVTNVAAIHDLGKILNRSTAAGQIEGGVVMGLGYALFEDMPLNANNQWVDSFSEYLLPTSLDIPGRLEIEMLEYPELDGPFGAKGLAEICVVPTAPAIANAVYNAVGVRVRELPITPEKLILRK